MFHNNFTDGLKSSVEQQLLSPLLIFQKTKGAFCLMTARAANPYWEILGDLGSRSGREKFGEGKDLNGLYNTIQSTLES